MARTLRYANLSIDHPGARDREKGETSKVRLNLVNARNGIESVDLTEEQLLQMVAQGSRYIATLRGVRT